jgi:hypothetical protein
MNRSRWTILLDDFHYLILEVMVCSLKIMYTTMKDNFGVIMHEVLTSVNGLVLFF